MTMFDDFFEPEMSQIGHNYTKQAFFKVNGTAVCSRILILKYENQFWEDRLNFWLPAACGGSALNANITFVILLLLLRGHSFIE